MNYIVFDIETAPLDEETLLASAPTFDPSSVKVGNIKDPALIAEKVKKAEAKHKEDILSSAALDPLTGWVCAVGYWFEDGWHSFSTTKAENEADVLRDFWRTWAKHNDGQNFTRFIGHNIFEFDLPFIIARSWKVGVPVPYNAVKFGHKYPNYHNSFACTRQMWLLGRKSGGSSLDSVAKCLIGQGKNGEGADFYKLLCGDSTKEQAMAYLKNDLELTAKVAYRLGLLDSNTNYA
jgi:hypothetical protein